VRGRMCWRCTIYWTRIQNVLTYHRSEKDNNESNNDFQTKVLPA
jgi:hypothetical protein